MRLPPSYHYNIHIVSHYVHMQVNPQEPVEYPPNHL